MTTTPHAKIFEGIQELRALQSYTAWQLQGYVLSRSRLLRDCVLKWISTSTQLSQTWSNSHCRGSWEISSSPNFMDAYEEETQITSNIEELYNIKKNQNQNKERHKSKILIWKLMTRP